MTKWVETEFSRAFHGWRERRGLDQAGFGRLLGCGPTNISHLESGQPPSANVLLALEYDLDDPVPFEELQRLADPIINEAVRLRWRQHRERLGRVARDAERRGLPARQRRLLRALDGDLNALADPHKPGSQDG